MIGFFRLIYQAIGEFKKYTNLIYVQTSIYLVINIILIFIFKSSNFIYYCLATLFSNLVVMIILEFNIHKELKGIEKKYSKDVFNNIKVGFFILLGNLAVMALYGIDRWFIKGFYSVSDFAYYSFALSMLNLINVLISAISVIFYNYLSKNNDENYIKMIKNYLIILGVFASGAYFIFEVIVKVFLRKYIPSLNIIAISFASYPYMITINSLFVNLYKARKNEKRYVKVVCLMLGVSIMLNILSIIIFDISLGIALATTISFVFWYIYSCRDFKYTKITKNESMFLMINFITFMLTSHLLNSILGGIVYFTVIIITLILFFKVEYIYILCKAKELMKNIFKEKCSDC